MSEYQEGWDQGVKDYEYDTRHNGGPATHVALSDQSPYAHGYRDGYLRLEPTH